MFEPDVDDCETLLSCIARNHENDGTHWLIEQLKFDEDDIHIYKHNLFGYILSFGKQHYKYSRFKAKFKNET